MESLMGMLIPLSAIVLGLGTPLLAFWIVMHFMLNKRRLEHKERMAAIEKGVLYVPETRKKKEDKNPLTAPLILIGLGFAGILARMFGATDSILWALICFFIGASMVAAHLHFQKQKKNEPKPFDFSSDSFENNIAETQTVKDRDMHFANLESTKAPIEEKKTEAN